MYLSYHDSILYHADRALIKTDQWLNDNCIHIWFEILKRNPCPQLLMLSGSTAEHPADDENEKKEEVQADSYTLALQSVLFLSPSCCFMLSYLSMEDLIPVSSTSDELGDDANVFLELKQGQKNLIFLPVVSNADCEGGGGSHWSLLVCKRSPLLLKKTPDEEGEEASYRFIHLDSCQGSNRTTAKKLATRLDAILNKDTSETEERINFTEFSCLQQENSYDCGIFVLANAHFILHNYLAVFSKAIGGSEEQEDESEGMVFRISFPTTHGFYNTYRQRMLRVLEKLKKDTESAKRDHNTEC